MDLYSTLSQRINIKTIQSLCLYVTLPDHSALKEQLFSLVFDKNERVSYNALWVLTHLNKEEIKWVNVKRDQIINQLLQTDHIGIRRLSLTLLNRLPLSVDSMRSDFLDYCFAHICSTEPYAIRALCLKLAYSHCKIYPELTTELLSHLQLMEFGELPPALKSTRKDILCRISKLSKKIGSTNQVFT